MRRLVHRATGRTSLGSLLPLLLVLARASGAQTVTVVNMIPSLWSKDTTQNSEPTVAVNGAASNLLVGSAYASGMHFCSTPTTAPLFLSSDNGNSWSLACLLPTDAARWPMDMTVRISADAKSLYAGALDFYQASDLHYRMDSRAYGWFGGTETIDAVINAAAGDFSTFTTATLWWRDRTDQPQVRTAPLGSGRSLLWVGENRPAAEGSPPDVCNFVAAVVVQDPWASFPGVECLSEDRPPFGTVPASRAATVGAISYVIMYRPVTSDTYDVVVYRRDKRHFDALRDGLATKSRPRQQQAADCTTHDGLLGYRVAMCRPYPANTGGSTAFGQERRVATELSIAVDPAQAMRVYVAWAERSPTNDRHTALHFSHSENGGLSWTPMSLVLDHATNPALAVASDGAVGVLYEQLDTEGDRWNTQIAISTDQLATFSWSHQLASVDATSPLMQTDPYLGDYIHLDAKAKNFYGVFPASNDRRNPGAFPDLCVPTMCPSQRLYSGGLPVDGNGKAVALSIDPYFVRVER